MSGPNTAEYRIDARAQAERERERAAGERRREQERPREAELARLARAREAVARAERLPTAKRRRGPDNQPLVALSPRGRARYGAADEPEARPALQFRVDAERIWYIGIPRRGDMERMEALCRSRGLDFKRVSWRP